MKRMGFNNKLAVMLVALTFAFITAAAIFHWDGKVVDLATGAFISNLTMIVVFYYRKAPTETGKDAPETTSTISTGGSPTS